MMWNELELAKLFETPRRHYVPRNLSMSNDVKQYINIYIQNHGRPRN